MKVIDSLLLINASDVLDSFNEENIQNLFDDLFLSTYEDIKLYSSKINSFYANNSRIIKKLDYSKIYNSAFILMIADFLERFDYSASFDSIIRLCNRNSIKISSRLQASHLYLKKKNYNQEYLDIYQDILCLLENAHRNEEDDANMVTYTFSNYYHKVINDTHQYDIDIAIELQNNLKKSKNQNLYYFLEHKIIDYLININLHNYSYEDSEKLQNLISSSINKAKVIDDKTVGATFEPVITASYLIEDNSYYSKNLNTTSTNFKSIRSLSIKFSKEIENEDLVRSSLGRGTAILSNYDQLCLYMRDYGPMHKAKIESSLDTISQYIKDKTIEIIDWGCGQALASMVFFDYIDNHQISTNISQIILVEPSEISLKRGALHITKYNKCKNIKTVNKQLDELKSIDLKTNINNIKIHLFSNILDVEKFSIDKLASLIISSVKGINYFICVSPYIDDLKATRIERFCNIFSSKFNVNLLSDRHNQKRDQYWYCNYKHNNNNVCHHHPICTPTDPVKNRWTRYEKVFEVEI